MNKKDTKTLLELALDQIERLEQQIKWADEDKEYADKEIMKLREQLQNDVLAQRVFDLEQQLFRAPKPVTADALAALITGNQDKILSIKTVRAITGMGLKEAKDFVEDMGVWT